MGERLAFFFLSLAGAFRCLALCFGGVWFCFWHRFIGITRGTHYHTVSFDSKTLNSPFALTHTHARTRHKNRELLSKWENVSIISFLFLLFLCTLVRAGRAWSGRECVSIIMRGINKWERKRKIWCVRALAALKRRFLHRKYSSSPFGEWLSSRVGAGAGAGILYLHSADRNTFHLNETQIISNDQRSVTSLPRPWAPVHGIWVCP